MKLKHYFLLLAVGIVLLAGVALFATFRSHPTLFYVTECFGNTKRTVPFVFSPLCVQT